MADNRFRTREIALSGRLRTADDPATIGPNDLSICRNMRPSDQYPRGIGGMTKINTSALASTGLRNAFHFRKSLPVEYHILAWTTDGKVWVNNTAAPSQGAFEASALFTDTAGGSTGRFSNAPGGALAYANGKDACLWGGTEHRCSGLIDNPETGKAYDYTDLIIGNQTGGDVATIHVLDADPAWYSTTYVGSIMPLDGFKLTIGTANAVASTMTVKYWDGNSWEAVANLSDGTASGGVSLAQTGTVSFDSTAAIAKPSNVEKIYIYWYQVTVTASAVWSGVTLSNVTVSIPFQPIRDIWDGEMRPLNSVLGSDGGVFYDVTTHVAENSIAVADASTYADFGGFGTGDYIYIGCNERLSGAIFNIYTPNTNAITMSASYWNGDAWVSLTITDGTATSGATLNKSGWVTWESPDRSVEFKRSDLGRGKDAPNLYFYRLGLSAGAMSANVTVYYMAGIATAKAIGGYSFPMIHQNRTVLVGQADGKKNAILLSAQDTANVFNGLDSYEFTIGQEEAINAGASLFLRFGSSVQDMLMLAKPGEIHILEGGGTDSDPYRVRLLSAAIGCRAPLTMATIPVGDLGGGVRRQIAVFESQRGIEVFDGAALMDPMLSHDIRDKFDPNSSTYAGSSANAGFYDPVYDEYHWCPVGTAEWVFSFKYKKWYQPVRGTGKYLYGGFPVMDTSGNSYSYGFDNAGYVYRLENGTDFDGNAIVHALKTGAVALNDNRISEETTLRMVKVVQVAKSVTANSMTVTHFGDTDTAGNAIGSMSPAASGKRLRSGILNAGSKGPHVHHEFQLALTTTNETCGCEPIYIVAYYDGERQDVR